VKPEDWETALDPIELKIQENTVSIPWGSGEIIVPQESRIVRGSDLILQSGWLFGCGQGQTINISVNDYIIDLQNGCFGLEYLPGESAWFFLFEGAAKLLHSGQSDPISITAATMINLGLEDALSQAVYDPQIIAAIRGLHQKSIPISWEPTFLARVRDMLASLGVGTAQALTYASYMVMLSLLVIIPIIFFKHWRYNLSSASMRMNANDEEVK
jgi:hypothetical protein